MKKISGIKSFISDSSSKNLKIKEKEITKPYEIADKTNKFLSELVQIQDAVLQTPLKALKTSYVCLRTTDFSENLEISKVALVLESGDSTVQGPLRKIPILLVFLNMTRRIIYNRILSHCTINNLIFSNNFQNFFKRLFGKSFNTSCYFEFTK